MGLVIKFHMPLCFEHQSTSQSIFKFGINCYFSFAVLCAILIYVRRLTLLRHAKSSWKDTELADIDRPLNKRGRRDAKIMGAACAGRMTPPEIALISPAKRVDETIELFFEAWMVAKPTIIKVDELYQAGMADWIKTVKSYSGEARHLLACGHQPSLGDFAAWLCKEAIGELPTATAISILFLDGQLDENTGNLDFVVRPKEVSGGENSPGV